MWWWRTCLRRSAAAVLIKHIPLTWDWNCLTASFGKSSILLCTVRCQFSPFLLTIRAILPTVPEEDSVTSGRIPCNVRYHDVDTRQHDHQRRHLSAALLSESASYSHDNNWPPRRNRHRQRRLPNPEFRGSKRSRVAKCF